MASRKKEVATYMEGSMGASDTNSGGGNAAGTPDAETAMRVGAPVTRGDVNRDKAKLFPDRFGGGAKAGKSKTNPGQNARAGTAKRTPAAKAGPGRTDSSAARKSKSPSARGGQTRATGAKKRG